MRGQAIRGRAQSTGAGPETTISYEEDARRLRLRGVLGDEALEAVRDALARFGRAAEGCLTVDLTAVTELGPDVARYLVEEKTAAASEGGKMSLLRKLDTPADHALNAAADETADETADER